MAGSKTRANVAVVPNITKRIILSPTVLEWSRDLISYIFSGKYCSGGEEKKRPREEAIIHQIIIDLSKREVSKEEKVINIMFWNRKQKTSRLWVWCACVRNIAALTCATAHSVCRWVRVSAVKCSSKHLMRWRGYKFTVVMHVHSWYSRIGWIELSGYPFQRLTE